MTIRTYKPRRGRVTTSQRAALDIDDGLLVEPADVPLLIGSWPGKVVLEIGFGTGTATAAMADADRDTLLIAIDVHTPGIGGLLQAARTLELQNLVVLEADALAVLRDCVEDASLDGVRSYFPDPWPKARHHKRRLVTEEHAALLARRTRVGGLWHLATDWPQYATQMQAVLDASGAWEGGVIERPESRPVTHFERRALAEGRPIVDLLYRRETAEGARADEPAD